MLNQSNDKLNGFRFGVAVDDPIVLRRFHVIIIFSNMTILVYLLYTWRKYLILLRCFVRGKWKWSISSIALRYSNTQCLLRLVRSKGSFDYFLGKDRQVIGCNFVCSLNLYITYFSFLYVFSFYMNCTGPSLELNFKCEHFKSQGNVIVILSSKIVCCLTNSAQVRSKQMVTKWHNTIQSRVNWISFFLHACSGDLWCDTNVVSRRR